MNTDLEVLSILPWQDDEEVLRGMRSSVQDFPLFAWTAPEQTRQVFSSVRIRLDSEGGFHLLGEVGGILHLDHRGQLMGRTRLPDRSARIVDYVCDPACRCVLLEQFEDGKRHLNRLRRLELSGHESWSRVGSAHSTDLDFNQLTGSFTKLLLDAGGILYLSAEQHGPDVAVIDFETGKAQRMLHQRAGAGAPFLAAGRLYSVFFDEQTDRRGISILDVSGEGVSESFGDPAHFAWLVYPFGVDSHSRLHVWRDGRVARISAQGKIEVLGEIDGVAVRALDQRIFTSHAGSEGIVVEGGDAPITLSAPPNFRLVHVDEQGRYYVLGGEVPGKPAELRVFARDGQLESSESSPKNLRAIENRIPTYEAWQVDAQGRVTFTVTMPEGVAIVRSRKAAGDEKF